MVLCHYSVSFRQPEASNVLKGRHSVSKLAVRKKCKAGRTRNICFQPLLLKIRLNQIYQTKSKEDHSSFDLIGKHSFIIVL